MLPMQTEEHLFYSEDKSHEEKEPTEFYAHRATKLDGTREEIGGDGQAGPCRQALCRLRNWLHSDEWTAAIGRPVLGMPPIEDKRVAWFRSTDLGSRIVRYIQIYI
jgi:hypothetical protein